MEHNQTGHFLEEVYASLAPEFKRQYLNSTALSAIYVNPQDIERMVQMETKRIKENCLLEEQQYVEKMLLENPIIYERRINNNGTIASSSDITYSTQQHSGENVDVVAFSAPEKKDLYEQQKRAELCRRSRYNNKIKKAQSKYRHKFMTEKSLQSRQMFDCIQKLIEHAEKRLFNQGLPQERLQHLRYSFGVVRR